MVEGVLSSVLQTIGEKGLILNSKANDFYFGKKFTPDEIDTNINLLSLGKFPSLTDSQKLKLTSVLLYYQAEYRPESITVFKHEIETFMLQQYKNANIDNLYLLFNIIEFEERYRLKSDDQIKQLWTLLASYDTLHKPLEEYLLFKYYSAVLKYLLKDYIASKTYLMDIVIDFNDEIEGKNIVKTLLLLFLELKNSIMQIKIMEVETENDYKGILTHSGCLFDQFKFDQEKAAVKIGMKMCDLQMLNYEYTSAVKTLNELFKVMKRKLFITSSVNSSSSFEKIEENLAICTRMAYCNVILGNCDEGKKYVKKIEKMVKILNEARMTDHQEDKDTLLTRYSFYLLIYKQILKYGTVDKNEMLRVINLYKSNVKNKLFDEEDSLINIYCMNSLDTIAGKFSDKVKGFLLLLKSNRFITSRYFPMYFSIFNQISLLTKNVATDTSTKKQCEYVDKIKECAKYILDFTVKYLDSNISLTYIFSYPYFKELLIKIFFSYIYSFYFSKHYSKALEVCNDFEAAGTKLDLASDSDSNYTSQHYWWVIKLKGDVLLKNGDTALAVNTYLDVLIKIERDCQIRKAVVMFNIGVCYVYLKDFKQGKEYLLSSLKLYTDLDQISPGTYTEKTAVIRKLLSSLNI